MLKCSNLEATLDPAATCAPLCVAASSASRCFLAERLQRHAGSKQILVVIFVARCLGRTFLARLLFFWTFAAGCFFDFALASFVEPWALQDSRRYPWLPAIPGPTNSHFPTWIAEEPGLPLV